MSGRFLFLIGIALSWSLDLFFLNFSTTFLGRSHVLGDTAANDTFLLWRLRLRSAGTGGGVFTFDCFGSGADLSKLAFDGVVGGPTTEQLSNASVVDLWDKGQ